MDKSTNVPLTEMTKEFTIKSMKMRPEEKELKAERIEVINITPLFLALAKAKKGESISIGLKGEWSEKDKETEAVDVPSESSEVATDDGYGDI